MRTCRLLLGLCTVILAQQVRSEDLVSFGGLSSQVFVKFQETVWLNCSTPFPNETIYKTRLLKLNTTSGPNWYAAEVMVDDWENSTAYCISGDKESSTIVMAYALPSSVTVDLQTELEEGKQYPVTCTVYDVAPLEYLTINVLRGSDVIDRKSYEGPHVANRSTVSHVYTLTASRSDNLMNFSCEAVLSLRPESYTTKSPDINVQTYALPEAPVITVDKWIEAGTEVDVKCLVFNGFPPQDVNLRMRIENTELDAHIIRNHKGVVMGLVGLNETQLGVKTISCESHLFTLSGETAVNVTIYERPTLSFALSSDIVGLEENVTATCNVTNKNPEGYGLFISVDGKEERRVQSSTLTHTFTESRRTPSLPVICTAYIIENVTIFSSSTRILQVHYSPKFNESLCDPIMNFAEGETKFSCQADGNPHPTVECYANGQYINETVPARREMSGNYTCLATNQIGSVSKSGSVTVTYDSFPDWIWIVVFLAIAVLILAGIITAVFYVNWKNGRKGFYELLGRGHRQNHQNGNIPSGDPMLNTPV